MKPRAATLRSQILTSFLAFAAAVSLLFAASGFVIAYVVEDRLFEESIREEVARQQAQWRTTGALAPPLRGYVSIHLDSASFPEDLRRRFSPARGAEEYRGDDGRHYHVAPFDLPGGAKAYAVAEVGSRLVVRRLRGELLVLVGLAALAMLLAAALLGSWLALRATAPLSRLVAAVSDTRHGEVPQISAKAFPANEVGTLAATLERMLERTRAFVERESRFTRDASHELRTPLAIIRSSVELIEARGEVPPAAAKPLKRIADAARQMEQSVDLLLMLAREERAQSPADDLLLLPLVERIVLAESMRFDTAGFEVAVSVPQQCRIAVNETVASVILSNLIGNAFRHNKPTAVEILADGADVVVRDRGRGIPAAALEAFESDSPPLAGAGGGLGLSIVGRLCRVHGIPLRIQASSTGTEARIGLVRVRSV